MRIVNIHYFATCPFWLNTGMSCRNVMWLWQTQLSLAKLCAMVTMKKPGETSIQSFSLPLTSLVTSDDQTEPDHEAIEKVCLPQ